MGKIMCNAKQIPLILSPLVDLNHDTHEITNTCLSIKDNHTHTCNGVYKNKDNPLLHAIF